MKAQIEELGAAPNPPGPPLASELGSCPLPSLTRQGVQTTWRQHQSFHLWPGKSFLSAPGELNCLLRDVAFLGGEAGISQGDRSHRLPPDTLPPAGPQGSGGNGRPHFRFHRTCLPM